MNIKELKEKAIRLQAKVSFNAKQKTRIYSKLSGYVRNGVSVPDALRMLLARASADGRKPNDPIAYVLREWYNAVMNGRSLARGAAPWISDSDRIVLEAGEKAGRLDIALENALFIAAAGKKIRSAVIFGLAYPLGLIVVAVGLCLLFGYKVIPAFEEIIPPDRWEGGAALLLYISAFANYYVIPTLVALIAVVAVLVYAMPRWVGPIRAKADKYPPFGIYRLVNGAGFMLSVSALIRAGMALSDILITLQKGATPWYEEKIGGALRHVSNGKNLGDALFLAGHDFPDHDTVVDLRDYATMDRFDETLEKLGREWVEGSVAKIQSQMAILKQIGMVIVGVVFAAIAQGLVSLQSQLQTAIN